MPFAAAAAAAVVGAGVSAYGASKASKTQRGAAERADALQLQAQQRARADFKPYQESGTDALGKLSDLIGIGTNVTGPRQPTLQDAEDEYMRQHLANFGVAPGRYTNPAIRNQQVQEIQRGMQERYAAEKAEFDARPKPAETDPTIGSLLRNYETADFERDSGLDYKSLLTDYTPQNFRQESGLDYQGLLKNFTTQDFVKDPGYEFRLGEGEKGIDRAAASRGAYDSGATLKALQRYGQDYASSEFQNAYSRDAANKARGLTEFGNAYNRDTANKSRGLSEFVNLYNRDNAGKGRTFGFLSDLVSGGRQAAGGASGITLNTANRLADSATGLGNAQAAAQIAQYSGAGDALGSIGNWYAQSQTLDRLQKNQQMHEQMLASQRGAGSVRS